MTSGSARVKTARPMLALLAGAALTLGALLASPPRLAGGPTSWTGDDLARAGIWWGAVVGSAWLATTALVCVAALAHGSPRVAHRVAAWAPPLARRVLRAALVSTWALVPATASAAPPSAPITVHVDVDGRLTPGSGRSTPSDVPVVRAPPTTAPSRGTTTTTTAPRAGPGRARRSRPPAAGHPESVAGHAAPPVAAPPRRPTRSAERVHVVRSGDNLWRIARAEVIRTSGVARPDDSHIASYWRRLISANHATLRSGDPSLIFPGEVVTLPTG